MKIFLTRLIIAIVLILTFSSIHSQGIEEKKLEMAFISFPLS
jgi:hypothetical protein